MAQSFYEEIDINGNVGKPGQVKSYEVTMFTEQAEAEAEEMGMSLEEYLRTWWNECSMETVTLPNGWCGTCRSWLKPSMKLKPSSQRFLTRASSGRRHLPYR